MYFHVPIEARAALDKEQPVKRQLIEPPSDDPIGDFFTSLFGIDPPSTTTGRTSSSSTPTRTNTRTSTEETSTSSRTRTRTSSTELFTPPAQVEDSTTTVTSTSTEPVNTGNLNDTNQSTGQSGLSPVVIGVIVAASVIFALVFLALIARKFFQHRRRNRRTWAGTSMIAPFDPPLAEKDLPPAPASFTRAQNFQSSANTFPAYPPAAIGYKNPQVPGPYSPAAPSSAGYPAPYSFGGPTPGNNAAFNSSSYSPADLAGPVPVVLTRTPPTPTHQLAVVKRTYVPSLPDELSISNGETIRVLSMYDDGWAMCEKLNGGEKGVVPQECLEVQSSNASNTNLPSQQLAVADNTRLQRNSSLRSSEAGRY